MDEYEVAEEELYNHIGIFLENNANLLQQRSVGGGNDSDNEPGLLDDSRIDQNYSNQQRKGTITKRQQAQVGRIRDQAGTASGVTHLATKKVKR